MARAAIRKAEAYSRTRVRCPGCGEMGTLIVGSGLYPYVEHCYEREIKAGGRPECWIPRDHPLVVAVLEQRKQAA